MTDTRTAARAALTAELAVGFRLRDRERVESAAVWLRSSGMPIVDVYDVLVTVLAEEGGLFADSPLRQVRAAEVQEFLRDVVARLRPQVYGPGRGQVVVGVPQGQRHLLGLAVLHHVIEDYGFRVVQAGPADFELLEQVVRECTDPVALVVGLHDAAKLPRARAAIGRIRAEHPHLRVVVGGQLAVRPDLAAQVGAHSTAFGLRDTMTALEEGTNPLSPRERDVLVCVASGLSNPDTGTQLGVASATVKTHLDRVYAKLGTRDRTAAVAVAMRRGWID